VAVLFAMPHGVVSLISCPAEYKLPWVKKPLATPATLPLQSTMGAPDAQSGRQADVVSNLERNIDVNLNAVSTVASLIPNNPGHNLQM
jgi:hypothetical protein